MDNNVGAFLGKLFLGHQAISIIASSLLFDILCHGGKCHPPEEANIAFFKCATGFSDGRLDVDRDPPEIISVLIYS